MIQGQVCVEVHIGLGSIVGMGGRIAKSPVKIPNRPRNELATVLKDVLIVAERALGLQNFIIEDVIV